MTKRQGSADVTVQVVSQNSQLRHCEERSFDAIQKEMLKSVQKGLDCFASLAMTKGVLNRYRQTRIHLKDNKPGLSARLMLYKTDGEQWKR